MNPFHWYRPALLLLCLACAGQIWARSPDVPLHAYPGYPSAPSAVNSTAMQMGTSPNGGAMELVLKVIASAENSIQVAAYSFTSQPIAEALIKKHRAGVKVLVVMDQSQLSERYSSATFLANAGIPVRINQQYAIMHSKVMLVDSKHVQTGSFNYTRSAVERNSENVLVVWNSPPLANQYGRYWHQLWNESEAYLARR